jgi:ribokinase
MGRRRVVVVGSANVDLVVDIARRPLAGETILGSDLTTTPGGKGANQAVAAGRLGADVAFVGCVGDDAAGRLLHDSLLAAGVDVSMLRTVTAPTGTAIIMVTPDGDNSIIVAAGASRRLTTDVLAESRALWQDAAVVVAQLEIPLPTVHALAERAASAGVRFVLNAAPALALTRATLRVCDPLVVNETEAAFMVGADQSDPITPEVMRALLALGPRSVVVTLGGDGVLVACAETPDEIVHVLAESVAAVDTTGAGDAFVGGSRPGRRQPAGTGCPCGEPRGSPQRAAPGGAGVLPEHGRGVGGLPCTRAAHSGGTGPQRPVPPLREDYRLMATLSAFVSAARPNVSYASIIWSRWNR